MQKANSGQIAVPLPEHVEPSSSEISLTSNRPHLCTVERQTEEYICSGPIEVRLAILWR